MKNGSVASSGGLVCAGLFALAAGASVYLIDRPPDSVLFVQSSPVAVSFYTASANLFGAAGYFLPSFFHVFAFAMLTACFVTLTKRACFLICLFWLLLDSAFELGQGFPELAVSLVPGFFGKLPLLDTAGPYFVNGTFDYLDLAAIALGAVTAWLTLTAVAGRRAQ